MYFIKAASTIGHQATFRNKGFSQNLVEFNVAKSFQPDYKEFINAGLLRRMSEIMRMSIACSMDCMQLSKIEQPDAIIVGTGLGCLYDTEKFLNHAILIKEGLIPPTSFIQSTHNTIAGQISLVLGNHNYNMTHTQNTLSFELALQDAFLKIDEGSENILTGAADERIDALQPIAEKLGYQNLQLTSGASFFMISKTKDENTKVQIRNVASYGAFENFEESMDDFLIQSNIKRDGIDLILFSSLVVNFENGLEKLFPNKIITNYQQFCGMYFGNSSFAVHLASDILESGNFNNQTEIKRILICNNLNPKNLGLTIVETIEA